MRFTSGLLVLCPSFQGLPDNLKCPKVLLKSFSWGDEGSLVTRGWSGCHIPGCWCCLWGATYPLYTRSDGGAYSRCCPARSADSYSQRPFYCSPLSRLPHLPHPRHRQVNCWQSRDHYVLTYDTVNTTKSILDTESLFRPMWDFVALTWSLRLHIHSSASLAFSLPGEH